MDYHKLNQVVSPITSAVPDVVSLFEQTNPSHGTWCAALNLENIFSSIPVYKVHQKKFVFSWQGQPDTFIVLPQGYVNSLALSYNCVCRNLDHLSIPQDITLGHNIDDIMMIGPSGQEVATTLELRRYLCVRG